MLTLHLLSIENEKIECLTNFESCRGSYGTMFLNGLRLPLVHQRWLEHQANGVSWSTAEIAKYDIEYHFSRGDTSFAEN